MPSRSEVLSKLMMCTGVASLERNGKGHPVFIRFSQVESFSSGEMLKRGQKHLVPVISYLFEWLVHLMLAIPMEKYR